MGQYIYRFVMSGNDEPLPAAPVVVNTETNAVVRAHAQALEAVAERAAILAHNARVTNQREMARDAQVADEHKTSELDAFTSYLQELDRDTKYGVLTGPSITVNNIEWTVVAVQMCGSQPSSFCKALVDFNSNGMCAQVAI